MILSNKEESSLLKKELLVCKIRESESLMFSSNLLIASKRKRSVNPQNSGGVAGIYSSIESISNKFSHFNSHDDSFFFIFEIVSTSKFDTSLRLFSKYSSLS